MKRRDKVVLWLSLFFAIEVIRRHDSNSLLGAVGVGEMLWLVTCYKRPKRAKITAIVALVLTPIYDFFAWKFSWPVAGGDFLLICVAAFVLWWHARRTSIEAMP